MDITKTSVAKQSVQCGMHLSIRQKKRYAKEESSYFKFVEVNYVNRVKARREQIYAEMLIQRNI